MRGSFPDFDRHTVRNLPRRALGWFRDLSGGPKLVLVGLVLLVVLVVLSPVVVVVAILLFGVSIIALMLRVAQKGPLKNWGIVAVGSVILVFTFGFMSDALYGIGFVGSLGSGSGESGGTPAGSYGSDGKANVAYDVVSEDVGTDGDSQSYDVVSSSNDLESLNLVAQEVQQERLQQNSGIITFYDSRAAAESADINGMVGIASIYLDEMQVRAHYGDGDLPLSTEEVEQVVDVIAGNGYVQTNTNGGEHMPEMPGFMYEDRDPSSATTNSSASSTASPSASDEDQVSLTGVVFGYPESFNYDGLSVTGQVVDWDGNHVMVLLDPLQGEGVYLGFPGQQVTVDGEYQGALTTDDGRTYETLMADDVQVLDE